LTFELDESKKKDKPTTEELKLGTVAEVGSIFGLLPVLGCNAPPQRASPSPLHSLPSLSW